ncbi:methylmalonyl-CoA mutase [Ancylobacter dichloromethanicus]|uniref:Methylmalonyl-CoA mutase n=1 Tax=Ancylobacter dichloromethanicus TaxID=518825 RepID=A0A9W6N1H6_9HYPH|nr:methylmalonyl-CoA mutase family protein [Ancylobacter dichloromethanicus]MBS7552316.1 methylmalonyl-CoA mutase [Ancylobacter dichloromethanicus]GLK74052.1 methylmalonyl-CoA mutase [Ancylobacter dichloromethanicus]
MHPPLDLDLAGFPPATRADWLALVEGVLKGAPYDRRMVTRTADGYGLDALPERRPNAAPIAGRPAGAPWKVIARIDHDAPATANAQMLEDLTGGADGVSLVFASAPSAGGFGLPARHEELVATLDGLMADMATLRVEVGGFQGRDIALALARLFEKADPAELDLRFGLDPIGDFAALGAAPIEWEALSARLGQTVTALYRRGLNAPMVRADGRLHHGAGATDAQELAAVLATALAYLKALEAAGLPLDEAARLIEVTLTADVDQFGTQAKPRAFRLLWQTVLEGCGLASSPVALHMETAWRSLTRHDAHVNLLRGTLAAFAAGVGGADSVSVLPFTQALGLADAEARRLARNTQIILIEESNLHRVADPGAGAGAIEERTEKLAATAWELFRQIEREGGMVEALASGAWQARLKAARMTRAKDVATRRQPLTGTSEFPLLGETAPSVLAPARRRAAPTPAEGALLCEPLVGERLAEPFERLREAAAAARPCVFLANLGTPADFTPRASFTRAAFEAGGITAPGNDGFTDMAALADAFRASGARIACLCGSDAAYAAAAVETASALKAAGAVGVYLAGTPGEDAPAHRAAGIDGYLTAGMDLVAFLDDAQARLGIARRVEP